MSKKFYSTPSVEIFSAEVSNHLLTTSPGSIVDGGTTLPDGGNTTGGSSDVEDVKGVFIEW